MTERSAIRVLLIDDDEDDYIVTREKLRQAPALETELKWAGSFEEGLAEIRSGGHEVFLVDYDLGGHTGLDLLSQVPPSARSGPAILLTSRKECDIDLAAQRQGVFDFLVKERADSESLGRALRYSREKFELLEQVREESQAQLDLQSKFLSHVSHELRSPLASAYQYATLVLDGIAGPVDEQQKEFLGAAVSNLGRLNQMVDDLLEVTRLQSGKYVLHESLVCLADVLRETETSFQPRANAAGVEIQFDVQTEAQVVCDAKRMAQVVGNFVDNAIKFTDSGGTVRVALCEVDGRVTVSVVDNGPGLSAEDQKKVFDRLYQADGTVDVGRRGLGLGLHICREILRLSGSEVRLESTQGQGSSFSFALPVFSWQSRLEPLAASIKKAGDSAPMVGVSLLHLQCLTDRRSDERPMRVLGVLEDSIREVLPSDCILLPRVSGPGGETFFVATRAEEGEAWSLLQRIEAAVEEAMSRVRRSFECGSGVTYLGPWNGNGNGSDATFWDGFVGRVEAISKGGLDDGRAQANSDSR